MGVSVHVLVGLKEPELEVEKVTLPSGVEGVREVSVTKAVH